MGTSLCAMATLDEASTETIISLKKELCTQGVACDLVPPHITLGIYEDLQEERLLAWTRSFAKEQARLLISYSHIGFFASPASSVCFVAPVVNKELLALHQKYHQQLDEYCLKKGFYYSLHSNSWVPHCTLFMGEKQNVETTIPLLVQNFTPFSAWISGISVGYFLGDAKEYRSSSEIEHFDFIAK